MDSEDLVEINTLNVSKAMPTSQKVIRALSLLAANWPKFKPIELINSDKENTSLILTKTDLFVNI